MYELTMDIREDGNVSGVQASFDNEEDAKQRVDREIQNEDSKVISAILYDLETGDKTRLA